MKLVKKICLLSILSSFLTGCVFDSNDEDNTINRLDIPTNLVFSDETYILSWTSVAHATDYTLEINGLTYKSESNSFRYIPRDKVTTFKVQSNDKTNNYNSSKWSSNCIYTIPDNQDSIATLRTFVNGMLEGYRVEKVLNVYAEDNYLFAWAVFDDNSIYLLMNAYESNITSLKDIVNTSDHGVSRSILGYYKIKDYDSISYYLQSDTYKGGLEDYRQQGYSFTPIISQSYKVSSVAMGIATLFKISDGVSVKYLVSGLYFVIEDTANDAVKYTTALVNVDSNRVRELRCIELSGDFVDYAQILEEEHLPC